MPLPDRKDPLPGAGRRGRWRRWLGTLNRKELHSWIQSSALLIATGWGIYTFIWSDILVPSWAPAHINLSLSLNASANQRNSREGREVTLTIKADNPSGRKLHLLSNIWQLFGSRRVEMPPTQFRAMADATLRSAALVQAERQSVRQSGPLLAVGRLFDDTVIQPGESLSRSILLRIPATYDAVDISVIVPALTRASASSLFQGRRLEWGLTAQEELQPMLCRIPGPSDARGPDARDVDCRPASATSVERSLRDFDERMQIFTRSEQFALPQASG